MNSNRFGWVFPGGAKLFGRRRRGRTRDGCDNPPTSADAREAIVAEYRKALGKQDPRRLENLLELTEEAIESVKSSGDIESDMAAAIGLSSRVEGRKFVQHVQDGRSELNLGYAILWFHSILIQTAIREYLWETGCTPEQVPLTQADHTLIEAESLCLLRPQVTQGQWRALMAASLQMGGGDVVVGRLEMEL